VSEKAPLQVGRFSWSASLPGLLVALTPTDETEADTRYTLDLYERGQLRESTSVMWSISELNAGVTTYARFALNRPEDEEYRYRSSKDLADIFSVEVSD
jgi:hypothetical protein